MNVIKENIDRLKKLCRKYKVNQLYVFGSVLTEKFTTESDIDFVVSFNSLELYDYADNYYELKFSLENLFNRNIDLLEEKALKNPFLVKSINNTKKLVYG